MYIESLSITRFGGLSDLGFSLGPGVNIIEGRNEAGKTTIAAFIRYMLFGFSNKNERAFYCGTLGVKGTLNIADENSRVLIERECGDGGESVRFIDLSDNSVISEDGCPGEMLLGVPVEVYDRTAYVGQLMGAQVEGGMNEAIENLLFSGDENSNTQKTLKRLDEERVALRHKNGKGGRVAELNAEREALTERLKSAQKAHETIFAKEAALSALNKRIDSNGALLAELEVKMRRCEDAVLARQYKELESLRREAEASAYARDASLSDMTHDGFVPDRTYLANLKLVKSELEMLGAELETTREAAEAEAEALGERTSYNFSPSAVLEELGGEKTVTADLRALHRKRTTLGILGGMLAGLFIAALFFGFLILMVNPTPGMIFIGTGLGCLTAAVILLIRSSMVRKKEYEILDALGVANIGEFYEYLPIWREEAGRIQKKAETTGLVGRVQKQTEVYRAKENELNVLAARWGSFSPDEIIADLEASLDEYEAFAEAAEAAAEKYEEAKSSLAAYSPEELRERLNDAPDERELAALGGAANLRRDHDFARSADKAMAEKKLTLEKELAAARATVEHPTKIAERIDELTTELDALTLRADALELAHEKLTKAAQSIRGSISPKLSEYAGNYLERLTDGKYATLNVDADLAMTYADDSGHLAQKLNRMSAGTGDLAYISLRLALIRLLYRNLRPALIFDESFSRLDENRLTCALGVLFTAAAEGTQSVVFTSHKRDADLMDHIGEYDYVAL